jgi:hypothetical protein
MTRPGVARPALLAAAVSCLIHLVRLVGPHGFTPVGVLVVRHGAGLRGNVAWAATELAVAVGAQMFFGALIYWSLEGSRWRRLTWGAFVPLAVGLNVALLLVVPSYFLIERDRVPEFSLWSEHCTVPGVMLIAAGSPVSLPPEGAHTTWAQRADGTYAVVRVPECIVTPAALPTPTGQPGGRVDFMLGLAWSHPDGRAIVERVDPPTGTRTWWLLTDPAASPVVLDSPPDAEGAPILVSESRHVAWLQRVRGSGPPVGSRVLVQPAVGPGEQVVVDLAAFGAASYVLLDADAVAQEIVLWRNDAPLVVGFEGGERRMDFTPTVTRPYASTYRRLENGWVAWDAYRDEGPYHLEWHRRPPRHRADEQWTRHQLDRGGPGWTVHCRQRKHAAVHR